MPDAIVTGASGFIGSALVAALKQQGQNLLLLTRKQGAVENPDTWKTLPPVKTVFHLAGRSYVPDSWQHPDEFIKSNVLGTQQALEYCREHGAHLILASAYVYGIPDKNPISEQSTAKPNNPYALSKLLAEEICEFYSKFHNIPVTILRIFNTYGSGQREDFLLPIIIQAIKNKLPIEVQTLTPKRDYVYITDVIQAFLKAQNTPKNLRRFNIGSGTSYSVHEIIDIAQKVANTSLPIISMDNERKNEIPDVQADIRLARELLDWKPLYSLEQGLTELINKKLR